MRVLRRPSMISKFLETIPTLLQNLDFKLVGFGLYSLDSSGRQGGRLASWPAQGVSTVSIPPNASFEARANVTGA